MKKKELVLFTGPDCPSCKIVKQQLIEKEIEFQVVDVGDKKGAREAAKYSIMSLPSMLVFVNGKVMNQYMGTAIIERATKNGDL